MNNKLLTISIASYNIERFIRDTVGSLIVNNDDLKKMEIIIVDDGSKDNTNKIAHELSSRFPESIIVIDKENGGYGSTINASLSIAKGKYYKLLDGDDWFKTDELPSFLKFLDKTEADLVVTPYIEIRDKEEKLIDNHPEISSDDNAIIDLHIDKKPFLMHEIAIKTETLRYLNKPIAEHCFYTDSEYVFYCIIAAKSISRYESTIYSYRLGVEGQSVSLEGIRKHQKDLPIVARRIMSAYVGADPENSGAKKDILNLCITNITYHTYRSFLLIQDPEDYRNDLIKLDKDIYEKYPIVYQIGSKSKLVRLVRKLHFRPYRILCSIALNMFKKENL